MRKSQKILFGGITIGDIEGEPEELFELKELLEEVTDRAYSANQKHLLADLAKVMEENACSDDCEKRICRGQLEAINKWVTKKLDAVQQAEEFMRAIDSNEPEDDIPEAEAGLTETSCQFSGIEEVKRAHTQVDPSLDQTPMQH